ncbi:DUF2971 domain-containing protein [Marinomonas sp. ef1]|uniref:DUF2971 domain-containing protein n=1 Tax=Marinomonas sp. ef1 TaxID=2005043 RepID=UPI000C289CCC|nr:DUF2971 domain-containing protein [Marinomonas sp. ef1]
MKTIEPLDNETELQKYMDFSKFVHLLDSNKLFLSKTSNFEDNLEGGLTPTFSFIKNGSAAALNQLIDAWPSASPLTPEEKLEKKKREKAYEQSEKDRTISTAFGEFPASDHDFNHLYQKHTEWIDVSCWHANDSESMAMWKIYGGGINSVCIISSVEKLSAAIIKPNNKEITISKIHYIDHENDHFKNEHPLSPLLHKSKFYTFENEVRLIAYNPNEKILEERKKDDVGTLLEVDLNTLIIEVRVAPDAPNWFFELVRSITQDKYGLKVEVNKSKINRYQVSFG